MITAYSPAMSTHRTRSNNKNNQSVSFQWQIPKVKLMEALDKKDASRLNTIIGQIGAHEKEAKQEIEANRGIMREVTQKYGGNPAVHIINNYLGFKFDKK
jgi:hypothetical protein